MLRRKSGILMAALFAAAAFMAGCSDDDDDNKGGNNSAGTDGNNDQTIAQIIQNDNDLSTFEEAVNRAGLMDQLQNQGQYTVFAPTNEAFSNSFSQEQLETLMNDSAALRDLILYHMAYGKMDLNSIRGRNSISPLLEDTEIIVLKEQNGEGGDEGEEGEEGEEVEAPADDVRLNYDTRARIVEPDINAKNGIVHKIDKVLNIRHVNN